MAWVVAGLGAALCLGWEVGARPRSEPPAHLRGRPGMATSHRLHPPAAWLHGCAGGRWQKETCRLRRPLSRPSRQGLLSLSLALPTRTRPLLPSPPLPSPTAVLQGVLGGVLPCHPGPRPSHTCRTKLHLACRIQLRTSSASPGTHGKVLRVRAAGSMRGSGDRWTLGWDLCPGEGPPTPRRGLGAVYRVGCSL